jgi:hypothetical protein
VNHCGTVRQVIAETYWASRRDRCIRVIFIARRLARTRASSSGAAIGFSISPSSTTTRPSFIGSVIIGTGIFAVSGTCAHRSLTGEVSLRSFDAVRMLDQSKPMASALSRLSRAQGTVVTVRTAFQAGFD